MNPNSQYFKHVRWLMIGAGIWQLEVEEFSRSKMKLYRVYSILIQVICTSPILSFTFNVPTLLKTDTPAAISNIGIIVLFSMKVYKMLMCQSKPIVNLLQRALQSDIETDRDTKRIYDNHIDYNNTFVFLLVGSATAVSVCISIFGDVNCYEYFKERHFTNVTIKPVLLHYWYPFDGNEHYAIVLIDQNVRPVVAGVCVGIVSAFVNSVVVYIRLQLKLLQHGFRTFDTVERLNELCVRHQRLIAYVADLNDSFNTIVFLEYLVSSVSFASQIFQITLGVRPYFASAILIYTVVQLFTFAWGANEIIVQSSELARALFESTWYDHESKVQAVVRVMMLRCQKPLRLKNGKFGVMDLDVFVSRLKLAYSYTSVMTSGD